jgi:hypothetical protein
MRLSRLTILIATIAAVAVALPAFAGAAGGMPSYFVYKKCSSRTSCLASAYTNTANTRIVALSLSGRCSGATSTLSGQANGPIRINSKHRYSGKLSVNSWKQGDAQGTVGVATVSGKVTKQNKLTLKYTIDKVAAGCENAISGSYTLKYAGRQTGG